MNRTKHFLPFIILLLSQFNGFVSFAQNADSTKTSDHNKNIKPFTEYVTEYDIDRNRDWQKLDTFFNKVEIFHPLYRQHTVFQDLGNIGTASRPLLFDVDRKVGFVGAFNPFETYFIKPSETRFYNTHTPFTELFYTQGSEELIFLNIKHSQNILPRWNIGLDFQRTTSQGFLLRQKTSWYHYQFYTRYQSKNKRYDLIAHATWNRGIMDESGGISNDSAYEALDGNSKTVLVRLNTAQTRVKARSAYIKQYLRFGNPFTVIKESDTLYDFQSRAHLAYTMHAEEISYIFDNTGSRDSILLPNEFYSTTPGITFDSLYNGKFENKLNLQLFSTKNKQGKDSVSRWINAGIAHQFLVVSQNPYVRNYQNVIAEAAIEEERLKTNSISYALSGAFTVSGYNNGDHKLNAMLTYRSKLFVFSVNGQQQLYKPDYNLLRNSSNQFIWDNGFKQINHNKLGVMLSTRNTNKLSITANYHLLNNWVYVGTDARPAQASDAASVITVEVNKLFRVWKFYFDHKVMWQHANKDYIRVPEFSGMLRYYFQSRFFASTIQVGADVFYNTSYYANAYNPASRLFYLQNDVKVGNYPVIDPFICLQIRRASIFGKLEHANENLINKGFYYTPHYPISLQSFRFGIRWRFFN